MTEDVREEVGVEPDRKRPYKAVAAAVAAMAAQLLGFGLELPMWLTVALTVVGAGATAYVTKNPIVPAKPRKPRPKSRRTKAVEAKRQIR